MKKKKDVNFILNRQNRMNGLLLAFSIASVIFMSFAFSSHTHTIAETQEEETPVVITTPTPTPTPIPTSTPTPSPTPIPSPTPTPTPMPEPFKGQSTFKSYESYKNITQKTSSQYKLQQKAYTGDYGIRMVEDRYCVAMGSYWATEIGTKMDVYLESGEVIKVILGDNKQDCHTMENHKVGCDNRDVLEFIVNPDEIPTKVKNCGSFNKVFEGKVVDVVIVED